jgi:hypothetical protein
VQYRPNVQALAVYLHQGQAPLVACELHRLANAFGLASQARQTGHGRDRHLAAIWGTGYHDRWAATTPMQGRTVCVGRIYCGIASTWPNMSSRHGPQRWLTICWRCTTPLRSGDCGGPNTHRLDTCVVTKIELHPSHNLGLISHFYIFSTSPTDINRNLFLDRGMLLFFLMACKCGNFLRCEK